MTSTTKCSCNNPLYQFLKDHIPHPHSHSDTDTPPEHLETINFQRSHVIYGGTIITMAGGDPIIVEAIGISDGYVQVTGTQEEVVHYFESRNLHYEPKDLKGATLLPGLIEPHVHMVPTALLYGWLNLGRFDGQRLMHQYDLNYIQVTIKNRIGEFHHGDHVWLLGREIDPSFMPFDYDSNGKPILQDLNNSVLDHMEATVPILILSASMHTMYANTACLKLIYAANSDGKNPNFGFSSEQEYIDKTQGVLNEADGMTPAMKAIPDLQKGVMFADIDKNLKEIFKKANSLGITMMYDAGLDNISVDFIKAALFLNRRVKTGGAMLCQTVEDVAKLNYYTAPTTYEDCYKASIKLVSDGSNQGLTGYQTEDYCCKDTKGIFNFPEDKDHPDPVIIPDKYLELVHTAVNTYGWPLMIHANGDAAVDFAITAYERTINILDESKRHRIEHCSILSPEHITRMKNHHISPSFLIGHVGYWGYAFDTAIFQQKAEKLDLVQSSLQQGLRITLHSDYEVSPLGPLRMMEQAITRKMEADPINPERVLNPSECLTVEQALRAVTYDAAWQCHADTWIGSLEPGKFADFVILATNPLTLTPEECYMRLRDITVLETWVSGEKRTF